LKFDWPGKNEMVGLSQEFDIMLDPINLAERKLIKTTRKIVVHIADVQAANFN
jgi:hypothetical protein